MMVNLNLDSTCQCRHLLNRIKTSKYQKAVDFANIIANCGCSNEIVEEAMKWAEKKKPLEDPKILFARRLSDFDSEDLPNHEQLIMRELGRMARQSEITDRDKVAARDLFLRLVNSDFDDEYYNKALPLRNIINKKWSKAFLSSFDNDTYANEEPQHYQELYTSGMRLSREAAHVKAQRALDTYKRLAEAGNLAEALKYKKIVQDLATFEVDHTCDNVQDPTWDEDPPVCLDLDPLLKELQAIPVIGGPELSPDVEIRDGPVYGWKLVRKDGSDLYQGISKDKKSYKRIQIGTVHTSPTGLYFFIGDATNLDFLNDLTRELEVGMIIGNAMGYMTEPLDLWRVAGYNAIVAPTGDPWEAVAEKLVYLERRPDLLEALWAKLAEEEYGPKARELYEAHTFEGLPKESERVFFKAYNDGKEELVHQILLDPKTYTGTIEDIKKGLDPEWVDIAHTPERYAQIHEALIKSAKTGELDPFYAQRLDDLPTQMQDEVRSELLKGQFNLHLRSLLGDKYDEAITRLAND